MTIALIKNNTVLAVTDSATFPGDTPYDGGALRFACPGAGLGWLQAPYTIVAASYTDTPGTNQIQAPMTSATLAEWTVQAGPPVTASGPRNWQTATPAVPASCTRAQGLLALLNNGFSTPEATITTAINAISDPTQQQTAMIKFQAANWYRADPFIASLGSVLGLTSAQIDTLFEAAQAY